MRPPTQNHTCVPASGACPYDARLLPLTTLPPCLRPNCSTDAEAFKAENESIAARAIDGFPMINRDFSNDWALDVKLAKDCLVQDVCMPGMLNGIPPPKTPIEGFFTTEWSQFYPNDRSVNNSIRIANACATAVIRWADEGKSGK